MFNHLIIAGIASLGLAIGSYFYGYNNGSNNEIRKYEITRLKTQEELFDLTDTVRKQNLELRRIQLEKKELVDELEQQAVEAPGSDGDGVGTTGGLRRLEQRWGSGRTTAD